jgi:hypothetical protein
MADKLGLKAKWSIALLLIVPLLAIVQYFLLPDWYRDSKVETSAWLIMLSVAAAIAFSILIIYSVIKMLVAGKLDPFNLSVTAHKGSKIGSYLGGLGLYPFAVFLGFVGGGTIGGGLGETIFHWLGLENVGIIIGIGLGLFLVTVVLCCVGAFVGFLIGGLTQKLAKI